MCSVSVTETFIPAQSHLPSTRSAPVSFPSRHVGSRQPKGEMKIPSASDTAPGRVPASRRARANERACPALTG